jgi:hypothetical protein
MPGQRRICRGYLETKDVKEMVTFNSCEKGFPNSSSRADKPGKKRKSPSYIARKNQEKRDLAEIKGVSCAGDINASTLQQNQAFHSHLQKKAPDI